MIISDAGEKIDSGRDEAARILDGNAVILPSSETPIIESAKAIFTRLKATSRFFWRGGHVHEISDGQLVPIRPEAFRSRIEGLGPTVCVSYDKRGNPIIRASRPSESDCKALLATMEARSLSHVEIVTAMPMLTLAGDGRLVRAGGGYCEAANAYVLGEHKAFDIPASEAARMLEELLQDFDFVSTGDKARALAFVVSVALRLGGFVKDNRVPLFVVEADGSQAGKGTLLDAVASIYGERPELVAEKSGGVGGFDESIQQRLVDGRPVISLDNIRGKIASAYLEAVLTAPGRVGCRIPHRGEIYVDPHRFLFCATSNGMQSTCDLANRSCVIRLRKRPEGYRFRAWPEGGLVLHVRENSARYLAAVHSIIQDWHEAGAQMADVNGHDFRGWHGLVEAIVGRAWPDVGPVIDAEHRETLTRFSDPARAWIRAVMQLAENGEWLTASEIADLCEMNALDIPACREDADEQARARAVGKALSKLFRQDETLSIDGGRVVKSESLIPRTDGRGFTPCKRYEFQK